MTKRERSRYIPILSDRVDPISIYIYTAQDER